MHISLRNLTEIVVYPQQQKLRKILDQRQCMCTSGTINPISTLKSKTKTGWRLNLSGTEEYFAAGRQPGCAPCTAPLGAGLGVHTLKLTAELLGWFWLVNNGIVDCFLLKYAVLLSSSLHCTARNRSASPHSEAVMDASCGTYQSYAQDSLRMS